MIDVLKYSEKIQKYLAGELSVNELVEFEKLIKKHPVLQDEIQLYRKVSSAIADNSLESFKKELDNIHNQNFASNTTDLTTTQSKQWYLVAALFFILISITSVFLFKSNEINPQLTFSKYYEPLAGDYSRGSVESAHGIAVQTFNNKNYNLALVQFEKITTVDDENYSAKLYLGVCGIELEKYNLAEMQFKLIIKSQDPFYIQDAEWYLALLYLKMKEVEKAVPIFEAIHKREGVFSMNASLILDELN